MFFCQPKLFSHIHLYFALLRIEQLKKLNRRQEGPQFLQVSAIPAMFDTTSYLLFPLRPNISIAFFRSPNPF